MGTDAPLKGAELFPLIAVAAMEYAVITPGLPSAALVPFSNVIHWLLSDPVYLLPLNSKWPCRQLKGIEGR